MTAEPRHSDFIPPPDEAVELPTPELATRLLAYLVALEDASGGYRQPQVVSQLHPNNIHLAGSWPDHAVKPHREAFLFAIGEAWAWLLLRPGARRVRQRRQHPAGHLTTTGNAHLRAQLVESAWASQHRPAVGAELRGRQQGLDPRWWRAWAAQLRLCGRFRRLAARKDAKSVAGTATAQALAGFLWAELAA